MQLVERITEDFNEYSTYVNEHRAIPHYFDGLKPVQRRVLYSAHLLKLSPDKNYKKVSSIVGSTMLLHPHGDASIAGALVKMAQTFATNYPLIEGRGNYGSLDEPPAAARYIEAKLTPLSQLSLDKLGKNVIPMSSSFDGEAEEPDFLCPPAPLLLINGAMGIGVGMATNVPSHCLSDICDGLIALVEEPNLKTEELIPYIKGPDFPSGCEVVNSSEFSKIYMNNGSFRLRAKFSFEGKILTIENFPQGISASKVEQQIYKAQENGDLFEIMEVINTTSKQEQLTLKLRKDDEEQIIKSLCAYTDCESTTPFNLRAIEETPRTFTLKDYLFKWLEKFKNITTKELQFDYNKLQSRKEVLEGLIKAIANIDEIIEIIKKSNDKSNARENLIEFGFSELQANASLDIRLSRLTKLQHIELETELQKVQTELSKLNELLTNPTTFKQHIINHFTDTKKLSKPRKTKISNNIFPKVIKQKSDKFYITDHTNYIKIHEATPKGKHLMGDSKHPIYVLHENKTTPIKNTKETVISNTHLIISGDAPIYHISTDGYVKKTDPKELQTSRSSIATKQDVLTALQGTEKYMLFATKTGKQAQIPLENIAQTKRGAKGVIGIKLEGEELKSVKLISSPEKEMPVKRPAKLQE